MPGLTILLVDDDPFMHRMLAPRLAGLEVEPRVNEVVSAHTPEDALKALERAASGPLAVLSDFNLKASMNGLQLLHTVRERRPAAVRVLFSGYSREQIGDVLGAGDAQAFLEKPMRIDEMLAPLAGIIRSRLKSAA